MSIETLPVTEQPTGFPELTELGKRIEVLRIQRGLSKQQLARGAGTSRQQLWRVATGKSELTPSLRQRIADVLQVDGALLRAAAASPAPELAPPRLPAPLATTYSRPAAAASGELTRFVREPGGVERALTALPGGAEGRRLKRALLDAIEDLAIERDLRLDRDFFELRRRVIAGEL